MPPPQMRAGLLRAPLRFLTWVCVVVLTILSLTPSEEIEAVRTRHWWILQHRPSEPFAAGLPSCSCDADALLQRVATLPSTPNESATGLRDGEGGFGASRPRARGWLLNGQDRPPDHCPEPERQDQRCNQRSSSRQSRSDQPCRATGGLRSPVNRGVSALWDHPFNHQLLPFGAEPDRLCCTEPPWARLNRLTRYSIFGSTNRGAGRPTV
jgi:hypothetical protein